jgi:hypothetical protein
VSSQTGERRFFWLSEYESYLKNLLKKEYRNEFNHIRESIKSGYGDVTDLDILRSQLTFFHKNKQLKAKTLKS